MYVGFASVNLAPYTRRVAPVSTTAKGAGIVRRWGGG